MTKQRAFCFIASLGAAMTASAFAHAGDDQAVANLQQRIAQLESQMRALSTGDNSWMSEQRAAEVRSIVNDVLADADTRANLLGSTGIGYDDGFMIGSQNGDFSLKISGQIQVRYVMNFQDESSSDSTRGGFENRRTKIAFAGNVFDPSWSYEVVGAFERDGGAFVLEDAIIEKTLDNDLVLTFGQFKLPFMREELTSSKRQLAVDRSLVNEEYNQDRSQGIQISGEGEKFRWAAAFSDGFGSDNTAALSEDTEYAFTGRVEFLGAGSWGQFKDFTSWQGEEFAWMLGAAGHFEEDEYGTTSGPEVEMFAYTLDASFEFGGANAFAAFVGRSLDDDAGTDVDQYGFVIQGGVFVTEGLEFFGRYEWSDFDTDGVEDLSVITVGVNKYWSKHNLKWSTDIGYGLDEVSAPFSSSGVGWRTDPSDEDGQIVIRSQLQLLF